MFSGSDSTESQNYTQWALNPSAYQNVSNDQVDWAALAQQWIIMKEAGPPVPDQMPNAPPPPNISKSKKDHEGGEAPMDVENDKDDEHLPQWSGDNLDAPPWNWQQQQQQQQPPQNPQQPWGWNNTWPVPAGVPPPNNIKAALLPTPPPFNQFPPNDNDSSNFQNYTTVQPSEYSGGYWTAAGSSKVIKPHNKRYSKVNVPVSVPPKQPPVILDAAKRKQLPAWIREGLEKMEREKQKQLDKEREKQAKKEYEEKLKLSEKEAMDIIKSTVKEQQQKGRFDSDDEHSDDTDGRPLTPEPVPLSQEELMLKVRRTMTEILLKVTNKEIYNICKEELQRHIKKLKASDQRVSAPSGANISAKLGLGVYGGSGSSSEDSEEDSGRDVRDSDSELKDTIKRRKAEFSKTEREIEERLAEAEGNEGEGSRAVTPESDIDSQVDAKNPGYKRRNSSDDTTPPSKTHNSKRAKKSRKSSSSDRSDSDRDKKTKRKSHRSTSSSGSDDKRRSSRYSRSVSRDRTPEQLKKSRTKLNSSQSRRSRSKSESKRRRRSRSTGRKKETQHRDKKNRRSRSHSRSYKPRRSRSTSRHRSSYYRSRRSRSRSRNQRSVSRTSYSKRSRSRSRRRQRSRSYSNGRGKRSHRH